jgi:uncharacterized membrane protein YccC
MASSRGKAPTLATRFCAMALVVTSGSPQVEWEELWFPLGVLAVVSVARTLDHAIAGPLKQQSVGPRNAPPGGWTRFAIAFAAASTASLWIGLTIDPARALWAAITTLLVMQPDARASYVRMAERIVGTVLGVAAAFAVTTVVTTPALTALCIFVVAPLVPHHLQHRYWLHTALIALLILLAYRLGTFDPRVLHGLFAERLEDVLLGAGLALIGTVFAFPRAAPAEDG